MAGTKTFDLNHYFISGKPVAYYDNTTKGGFDAVVVIDTGTEKIRVSTGVNKDKKPYFTESQVMNAGTISIANGTFHSYTRRNSETPTFMLKAGYKSVLLGVNSGSNFAQVGGLVSMVNTTTRKMLVDIPYNKSFGQPGQQKEIGYRQVVVVVPDNMTVPMKGTEVIVTGSVTTTNNIPAIKADTVEVIA